MRAIVITVLLALIVPGNTPVSADVGDELFKLLAADGAEGSYFGSSVAMNGTIAIIGADSDNDNGQQAGSAYVFDPITGQQLQKLLPDDGAEYDNFGWAVAISGTTAIIGARADDDNGGNSGSAYLFDTATGRQLFKLLASDGAGVDYFGSSVAIGGDVAFVGAFRDDDNGTSSGSVYRFDVSTGQQTAKLVPDDNAADDFFGVSVAISGTVAFVGASGDDDNGVDSGSVYVFDTISGQQLLKLLPDDGAAGDRFGSAVAISGPLAIVGALRDDDNGVDSGSAYLFDTTSGQQLLKFLPDDGAAYERFGGAVAISGTVAIIGVQNDDDNGVASGSAYLFDTITGQQIVKLLPDDGAYNDRFGRAVAIHGNTAIAGAYLDDDDGENSGSAYVFSASTDSDGDGLLDSWETNGIDVDGDGTIDIDLPAMGANPMHKDLFLEVDAMAGIVPTQAALDMVVSAFASAPNAFVDNPDGADGIKLHILVDDLDVLYTEIWEVPAGEWFPGTFDVLKNMFFGTDAERAHPASAALLDMKRRIFRYCIYCDKTDDGVLGVARTIHSNDFVMAKGRFIMGDPPALCDSCDLVAFEASTFMHELGHCLGLWHGGGDDVNSKPNYVSLMNYIYMVPFKEGVDLWPMDFSHGSMLPLDESNLDETLGFHDTTGQNAGRLTYFGETECEDAPPCTVTVNTDPITGLVHANGPIDFNDDGQIEAGVCVDLNYWGTYGDEDSPCETLNDHNDWLALEYALVPETASPAGSVPIVELTAAQVRERVDTLPDPLICLADLTGDGAVNLADLLVVLSAWGTPAGDVTGDRVTNLADLLAVLAAWGPC